MSDQTTVLIIVPGSINYHHNATGRRMGAALRKLGCSVDIHTLRSFPEREYDWVFVINILELLYSFGNLRTLSYTQDDKANALQCLRQIKQRSRHFAQVMLEPADTAWFGNSHAYGAQVGADLLIDLGLEDQSERVHADAKATYRFVFNGLTTSERAVACANIQTQAPRAIPWTTVGQVTRPRVELVNRLIREYHPSGYVYLPRLVPWTEQGPHLNETQFQAVLERSEYHIWCSHHRVFYMEGERFRMTLLAGAVPIKILVNPLEDKARMLFSYLLLDEADFPDQLRALDFYAVRQRFSHDFLQLPLLEDSLAKLLSAYPKPA